MKKRKIIESNKDLILYLRFGTISPSKDSYPQIKRVNLYEIRKVCVDAITKSLQAKLPMSKRIEILTLFSLCDTSINFSIAYSKN